MCRGVITAVPYTVDAAVTGWVVNNDVVVPFGAATVAATVSEGGKWVGVSSVRLMIITTTTTTMMRMTVMMDSPPILTLLHKMTYLLPT